MHVNTCQSTYLPTHLPVSVCQSACLAVCPSVHPSLVRTVAYACLYKYQGPFVHSAASASVSIYEHVCLQEDIKSHA